MYIIPMARDIHEDRYNSLVHDINEGPQAYDIHEVNEAYDINVNPL